MIVFRHIILLYSGQPFWVEKVDEISQKHIRLQLGSLEISRFLDIANDDMTVPIGIEQAIHRIFFLQRGISHGQRRGVGHTPKVGMAGLGKNRLRVQREAGRRGIVLPDIIRPRIRKEPCDIALTARHIPLSVESKVGEDRGLLFHIGTKRFQSVITVDDGLKA